MPQKKKRWGIGPIDEFIEKHNLRPRFDALSPPHVAPVRYRGTTYKFYIPDAMSDKMQLPPLLGHFHEAPLLEHFAHHVSPEGTICDLGANFGSHTLYFAAVMKARNVHSFEPQAHLVSVIQKTLELNNVSTVRLHHAAAGAKSGFVRQKSEDAENSGMTEFRPTDGPGAAPMVSVDDIVGDEHVTGVKIDIEGMQMPALRGMKRMIDRCRPVLWLELRPAKGEMAHPTVWLERRGYRRIEMSFRDFLFVPEPS